MSSIGVIGAGAFGTALAVSEAAAGRDVLLWGRDIDAMETARENARRLPGVPFPQTLIVTAELSRALSADVILLALPAQTLRGFLTDNGPDLAGKTIVACCKGIDLETGLGPSGLMTRLAPRARHAILTGPSFAADIGRGLPTALTLATDDADLGPSLQAGLATRALRPYLSFDPRGAELGGALKNVVAIAAGLAHGAGFGDSARAAVITRGFAEIQRLALAMGGKAETLSGLSGFGDLVLTCTSEQSRNFAFGASLGRETPFDPAVTVEGAATARAVLPLAAARGIEMPLTQAVAAVINQELSPVEAANALLSRPLTRE